MLSDLVKKELERITGRGNASFEKEDLLCYAYDATGKLFLPEAVVWPGSAEEVSRILKMANSEGFFVVPRGAGTGFTGGSVPVRGGVVLSLERMRSIRSIDTENLTASVQPGVVTWEFQQEVEKLGLFYPPDPTSLKFSTIGGNIAECAGGPRALKYGVTRDYVLGLEVVLPTGDIVRTGVRTTKGVVGYDLTRLLVGSEGTLGVVTEATLKLIPLPPALRTILAAFPDPVDGGRAVSDIIKSRITPSTLEFIDSVCLGAVREYAQVEIEGGAALLIEVDGGEASVEAEAHAIEEICFRNRAKSAPTARDSKEVKKLWNARRAISPSLAKVRPNKINEDVVVPRSEVPALIAGVRDISGRKNLVIACFGHAGDGNIHVNIMHGGDPDEERRARDAVRDVFELTLSLGGTISGEHGVGTMKAPFLGMELAPEVISLMKSLKKTFDPRGILNPGKIFPDEEKVAAD